MPKKTESKLQVVRLRIYHTNGDCILNYLLLAAVEQVDGGTALRIEVPTVALDAAIRELPADLVPFWGRTEIDIDGEVLEDSVGPQTYLRRRAYYVTGYLGTQRGIGFGDWSRKGIRR